MARPAVPTCGPDARSLEDAYRIMGDYQCERELDAERARMREQLLRTAAAGLAQQDLANAMVDELAAEARGELGVRRLIEPGNRAARVAHVAVREEVHLGSLSGGRLHINPARLRAAKRGAKP